MTVAELHEAKIDAAYALHACRSLGALVLRVHDGHAWRLQLYHASAVPRETIFHLLELEPVVMLLLKELAMGRETLPL